jgi:hypothetical protein
MYGRFSLLVAAAMPWAISCSEASAPAESLGAADDNTSAIPGLSVSADYVPTPLGMFHKSCVRRLPSGSHVLQDGSVSLDGKQIEGPSECRFKPLTFNRLDRIPPGPCTGSAACWAASSTTFAGTNAWGFNWFNLLQGKWLVPSNPASNGALLYYFNGMQTPGTNPTIIQPVLQWGTGPAGGGNKWTVGAWYVGTNGVMNVSSLMDVATDDIIVGTMTGFPCDSTTGICTWQVRAARYQSTTYMGAVEINATASDKMNFAAKAVKEAYSVTSCGQYPTSDGILFYDQALWMPGPATSNFNDVTSSQNWSNSVVSGLSPSCSVNVNTYGPGHADITWVSP